MFCFVVNFWNVRHHTGKDKTSKFFSSTQKKSLFMPIAIVNSQYYHVRHHEFEIKCNVFLKYFLIFNFYVFLSEIFIT